MSDDQKPLFFGGLPPRDSSATVEVAPEPGAGVAEAAVDRTPDWSKIRKWSLLGLVIACVIAAILFAVLALFPSLTEPPIPENIAPGYGTPEYVAPDEEATTTDEGASEAGGAVTGHTVSAELCAALDGFVAVSASEIRSTSVTEVTLAAIEALAAVESPNQAAYEGFANLVKDPASVKTTDAAMALSTGFAKAAEVDIVTCM